MSNYTGTTTTASTGVSKDHSAADSTRRAAVPTRRVSTETKSSYKTTEFFVYIAAVVGVLVASAIADEASDFGTQEAWFYVTLLSIGYMVSRGLAKAGSRDFYDDDNR